MKIDIKKIGKEAVKVLGFLWKVFTIYKFFKGGSNCQNSKGLGEDKTENNNKG